MEKEIVKGARCTLVDDATGEKRETQTDGFGDFWFEGLEEGTFTLTIEAEGFAPMTYASLDTSDDINLGEIALGRVNAGTWPLSRLSAARHEGDD